MDEWAKFGESSASRGMRKAAKARKKKTNRERWMKMQEHSRDGGRLSVKGGASDCC